MTAPIRIAQMMTEMDFGGVEMVVMNYYKNIDRSKVQFDFFALEGSSLPMRKEIEQLGGRVYVLPKYTHLIRYERAIIKLFKENDYKIVHSHMNALSVFSLFGAKVAGVPVRIAHNHSTAGKGETKKNMIKYILRPFSKVFPTHLCACTKYAGEWLFGKEANFKVFKNAIDLEKFKFNSRIRNEIRSELGLEGKRVIGHIGRFCYQKNHEFLIDVFNAISKKDKNSVLMLIGEGELESRIKDIVKIKNIEDKVLFLGAKSDAFKYYQAMDCFVLPSRYEGLGMVAIEAQVSGLPVICSNEVPREAKVTKSISFLDLKKPIDEWANVIIKSSVKDRNQSIDCIKDAGYDIKNEAKVLLEFYRRLYKR